jgi:hypothetical protein
MNGDEHATFLPFPGDGYPSAGGPLPALRPHLAYRPGNISDKLTEYYRRAHPKHSASPSLTGASAQRGRRFHRRLPAAHSALARASGPRRASNHRA